MRLFGWKSADSEVTEVKEEEKKDDNETERRVNRLGELADISKLTYTEKKSIAGLVACVSAASSNFTNIDSKTTWENSFLSKFTKWLELNEKDAESLEPLLDFEVDPSGFLNSLDWPKLDFLRVPLVVLLFSIQDQGEYSPQARVLVRRICTALGLDWSIWQAEEFLYGQVLFEHLKSKDAKSNSSKRGKWLKVGAVGVASGLAIGLTAGLAAPAVGVGLAAMGLSTTAAILITTTGAATLGSLFGAGGAGYIGYKMNKRVGDLKSFNFTRLKASKFGLSLVIGVPGWLLPDGTSEDIWQCLPDIVEWSDCYATTFDPETLIAVGKGLGKFVGEYAVKSVRNKAGVYVASAVVAGASLLFSALVWPAALIGAADVIDNPWSVAMNKAVEAGLVLADALSKKNGGGRPVTLVGFSIGARVLYYALKELARRKRKGEPYVDIENAFLISSPSTADVEKWKDIRTVVCQRLVNAYCESDWVLKFVYRTTQTRITVAGIMTVEAGKGVVENVDISSIISGHNELEEKLPLILATLGIDSAEPVVVLPPKQPGSTSSVPKSPEEMASTNVNIEVEADEKRP